MTITNTFKSVGARLTMGDDDVRALLEKDHDEVKGLLGVMVDGEPGRSRKDAFEALKRNLTAHSRAEEKVVYDALIRARAKQDVHVLGEEGYVEHGAVDDLLARISRLEVGTELWKAHAKVIKEMLEHHIAEEQNETFAQLGDLFSRDELVTMGQAFLRNKERVLTQQASKAQRNVARAVGAQAGQRRAHRTPAKTGAKTARVSKSARRPVSASSRKASGTRAPGRRTR